VPFEERGARADEYIEAMRALWTEDKPSYQGRFVSFSGVQARPRPVQQPHPPFIVGGMSAAAYRRATRFGNGWYGFALDLDGTEQSLAGLRKAAKDATRPAELGELEISVTPRIALDHDTLRRFEDLGVDRVVSLIPRGDPDKLTRFVEELASAAP
jgi:alkanesulfonate monooxygenase SsuD/methylene tetrahydromethanopterin reductase-like flavin-dependent oxidoreductase (luciferase family)